MEADGSSKKRRGSEVVVSKRNGCGPHVITLSIQSGCGAPYVYLTYFVILEIVIHSTSLVQYIHPPFICSFVWSFKKEDFKNPQNQPVAVMASSLPGAASQRRKRNHPGNPSKIYYL